MAESLFVALIVGIILSLFWNKMPKATRIILVILLGICAIPIISLVVMIAQHP